MSVTADPTTRSSAPHAGGTAEIRTPSRCAAERTSPAWVHAPGFTRVRAHHTLTVNVPLRTLL
jgi:hypothetical protein